MREALERCNSRKFYIFTGTVDRMQYNRLVVKNVSVFDTAGKHLGEVDHILVAKKPFKKSRKGYGDEVRFTGKVDKYYRQDESEDYSVIVNRVSA